MRIAHVSDCYLPRLGGIERQVHDLACRQRAAGHDVQVVTSVTGSTAQVDSIAVHRPIRRGGNPTAVRYASSSQGRRFVVSEGFDVVHVHASIWSPLAFWTAASSSRQGIPTVMTVHSLWTYPMPFFRATNAALHWSRLPLAWSAVSTFAAEPVRRLVGPATPIAVLPNGVDPSVWKIVSSPRDPCRIVMVSVMRLAARKRPRQLLAMLRLARSRVPADVRLEAVVIGDGPLMSQLRHYLDRHDMSSWVRLVGAIDHDAIREIYRDADFYLAPATLESFGIAALEARCAGLPVIAHAGSGIGEFVAHGREGLLARDDNDMVGCIVELATSPALLARLRSHNETTTSPIAWPDVLDRCLLLYDQAGASPSRTRPALPALANVP